MRVRVVPARPRPDPPGLRPLALAGLRAAPPERFGLGFGLLVAEPVGAPAGRGFWGRKLPPRDVRVREELAVFWPGRAEREIRVELPAEFRRGLLEGDDGLDSSIVEVRDWELEVEGRVPIVFLAPKLGLIHNK